MLDRGRTAQPSMLGRGNPAPRCIGEDISTIGVLGRGGPAQPCIGEDVPVIALLGMGGLDPAPASVSIFPPVPSWAEEGLPPNLSGGF